MFIWPRISLDCVPLYGNHAALEQPPAHFSSTLPITSQHVHLYRAMVKDRLHDAIHITIYMCGVTDLDQDDPCYAVFHCDPSLERDTHLESDFFVSRIQPDRMVLCCHCAGTMHNSLVELHTHLKAP